MSSETFFARFEAGQPGDEVDLLRWANQYQIYRETKAELDQMVALIDGADELRPEYRCEDGRKIGAALLRKR